MTIDVGIVGMVDVNKIIFEDRAREELGDLKSLEDNMKESGLIAPLAVKDNKDGTYKLLAGGRRFTVLKENNIQLIPTRIYEEDLTALEMKVIERAENFYRKDLEYWEFDELTKTIHQMRQELYGVKAPGPGQDGWGTRDTATMIGAKSPAAVTDSIKRAEAREAFPELFETCKSASDASKIIKKMDEALIKQVIAQKLETQNSDSTLHQLSKCFIIKDFFEGVKEIPDGIMHLVEIDPPYGVDLKVKKKKDGESQYQLDDYNEVDTDNYLHFMSDVFKQCYRVMADHSWLICWFAPEPWFCPIYKLLIDTGFNTSRMCGIWTKGVSGQSMNPLTRLANCYEMFFYAWKGQPALNKAGASNEFHCPPVPAHQKTHPTERPVELTDELYKTFAFPGSRILIPFLGSGNGLISAHHLGMTATGFELSKSYKDSFLVKVNEMR